MTVIRRIRWIRPMMVLDFELSLVFAGAVFGRASRTNWMRVG